VYHATKRHPTKPTAPNPAIRVPNDQGPPVRPGEPVFDRARSSPGEAAGIEPPRENTGKTALPAESGAKSGTLGAHFGPAPTDLRTVIDAWPTLPEAIRADIVAMVRTAGGDTAED